MLNASSADACVRTAGLRCWISQIDQSERGCLDLGLLVHIFGLATPPAEAT